MAGLNLNFAKVEYLYGTRWTAARIHFASSRYLPFFAIAMAIPSMLTAFSICLCPAREPVM
ncbi:hypothetical protein J3R83DRAFT_12752 [Lanmaoa asiatica]|nr:hypothetical protein J3R83DRAFT_12752 [Lanmaoa asiatica]